MLVASMLAIPLAFYLIGLWPESYAHHIDVQRWLFSLPLVVILLISPVRHLET